MPFDRPHDVHHWTSPKVRVVMQPGLGRSLVAVEAIALDELVMVTGGHIMTIAELRELPEALQHFPTHVTADHLIGRIEAGDEERGEFINHSCDPSCGMDGPLCIVARRAISQGEPITLDYAMCMSSDILDMVCECGANTCRGLIRGDDWRIPEIQQRYRGYFVTYIQRWIDQKQ